MKRIIKNVGWCIYHDPGVLKITPISAVRNTVLFLVWIIRHPKFAAHWICYREPYSLRIDNHFYDTKL